MKSFFPKCRAATVLCLLFAFAAGTGCSFAPDYTRPDLDLPSGEQQDMAAVPVRWWRSYNDPLLNALVREALQYNKDVAASMARVERAAALANVSRSDLFPAPSLDTDSSQNRASGKTANGAPPGYEKYRNHDVAVRAAWELDLWGKYRNSLYSALAALHETQSLHDAAMLLVAANTVKAYATLLSAKNRAEISEATVRRREQAVSYFQNTVEAGSSTTVELSRARGELEQARYNLHMARLEHDLAFSALSLLLGRPPRQIMEEKGLSLPGGYRLRVLDKVPDGLPMRLIEQRPDIRAAEYALLAAHFDIGVIRAQYLPSLTLSGSFGSSAGNVSQLGSAGATTWMYSGSVHLPLDFWSTHFRELMAEARCRELVSVYERTVLNAFTDVRNAVVRQERLGEAGNALDRMIKELRSSSSTIRERYREGYASYLEMLDADRSLFEAQLGMEDLLYSRISAEVDLYMALGGGWTEGSYPAHATAPADSMPTGFGPDAP
jgi:multidrug efflux system outer membrane protein